MAKEVDATHLEGRGQAIEPKKGEAVSEETKPEDDGEDDDDDDEEDDDDFDPNAKVINPEEEDEDEDEEDLDANNDEKEPDFSQIQAQISQVRTRSQRHQESNEQSSVGRFKTDSSRLVRDLPVTVDIDAVFNDLKSKNDTSEWKQLVSEASEENEKQAPVIRKPQTQEDPDLQTKKIRIELSYTFSGKVITETKLVDADSAEAKAYLNSTAAITRQPGQDKPVRSSVPVIRTIPGESEPVELQIKLKRPSLIDKFLSSHGSKKQKLSTLEKSRLDWASFVDKRNIADDLKIHNKAGYLDKQDFLSRVQTSKDVQYKQAQELERQRQWQLQQKN